MKYKSRHNKRADGYGYDYSIGCHVYYRYDTQHDTQQRYQNNEVYIFTGFEDSHSTPARPCVDQVTKTTRPINNDDEYRHEPDPTYWRLLTSIEILSAPMTNKNATYAARIVQAHVVKAEGYTGPIKGGEARAMSRFLTEIGKPDHVRRCWFMRETEWTHYPGTPYERKLTRSRLQGPIYVFKPLVEGFSFTQFMQIVRMYKPGVKGGCRAAIRKAMASPDMAADLEMLNTLDTLAGLVL